VDETRRAYNQAWFARILLDIEGPRCIVTAPRRTEAIQAVKTAAIRPRRRDRRPGVVRVPTQRTDAALSDTASIPVYRV